MDDATILRELWEDVIDGTLDKRDERVKKAIRACTIPKKLRGKVWLRLSLGRFHHTTAQTNYSRWFRRTFKKGHIQESGVKAAEKAAQKAAAAKNNKSKSSGDRSGDGTEKKENTPSPPPPIDYTRPPLDGVSDGDLENMLGRHIFGCVYSFTRFLEDEDLQYPIASRVLLCLDTWCKTNSSQLCPMLPVFVCVALNHLEDYEVFAIACHLLKNDQFLTTRRSSWARLHTLSKLARQCILDQYTTLCANYIAPGTDTASLPFNDDHPLAGGVLSWICEDLHPSVVTAFFDLFLLEGVKTYYRVGLAVLETWYLAEKANGGRIYRSNAGIRYVRKIRRRRPVGRINLEEHLSKHARTRLGSYTSSNMNMKVISKIILDREVKQMTTNNTSSATNNINRASSTSDDEDTQANDGSTSTATATTTTTASTKASETTSPLSRSGSRKHKRIQLKIDDVDEEDKKALSRSISESFDFIDDIFTYNHFCHTAPQQVLSIIAHSIETPSHFFRLALSFKFRRAEIAQFQAVGMEKATTVETRDGRERFVDETDASLEQFHGCMRLPLLPKEIAPSNILSEDHWKRIWPYLPARIRLEKARCIHSTLNDGYSLHRLYANCGHVSPILFAMKTTSGHTLGAFITQSLEVSLSSDGYVGTGEMFLFSNGVDGGETGQLEVFPWVGARMSYKAARARQVPEQYMSCTMDGQSIGGGETGHAIQLNSDLNGSTTGSTTFLSPPLLPSEMFSCDTVEVWDFV